MVVQPNSTVNLYRDIPIENGLTLAFSSKYNQTAYFNRHLVRSDVECTIIKKTGKLQLEIPGNVVTQCNYISFINPSFDNRTFYALITDYEYINNECTSISYSIDFLQTYMFDLDFKSGTSKARESLSNNEAMKAGINPYDPTIYPLSTPEDLAFGPSIEPPVYEYYIDYDGVDRNSNSFSSKTKYDGFYISDIKNLSNENVNAYMNGYEFDLVMFLAPIDFSEISSEVQASWTGLMSFLDYCGGDYIPMANESLLIDTWGKISSFKSLNLRAYDIIRIPLYINAPENEYFEVTDNPTKNARIFFKTIIDKITYLNATSQIISIYTMPYKCFRAAFKPNDNVIELDVENSKSNTGITKYMNTVSGYSFLKGKQTNGDLYKFTSPKLYRHPYTYLRVESPDLATKEYKFENFYNFAKLPFANTNAITETCSFVEYGYLDGTPRYFIAPYKYGYRTDGGWLSNPGALNVDTYIKTYGYFKDINHTERMEYSDFPMVPFTTDAYLTFLSNQVMNVTRANTADFQDQLSLQKLNAGVTAANTMTNLLSNVVSLGASGGTSKAPESVKKGNMLSSAANTTGGVFSGVTDFANIAVTTQSAEAQIEEANKYFSGIGGPSIDYGRYNDTKPAFANNIYHAGSDGSTNLLSGIGNYYFKFTYVHPKNDVLEKYDNYFKMYGYNQAGRTGVPYIANYFKNVDPTEYEVPGWVDTDDGESYYIQTMNCEVTGAPLPVITFIKTLFNNGLRFIKGDDL